MQHPEMEEPLNMELAIDSYSATTLQDEQSQQASLQDLCPSVTFHLCDRCKSFSSTCELLYGKARSRRVILTYATTTPFVFEDF